MIATRSSPARGRRFSIPAAWSACPFRLRVQTATRTRNERQDRWLRPPLSPPVLETLRDLRGATSSSSASGLSCPLPLRAVPPGHRRRLSVRSQPRMPTRPGRFDAVPASADSSISIPYGRVIPDELGFRTRRDMPAPPMERRVVRCLPTVASGRDDAH